MLENRLTTESSSATGLPVAESSSATGLPVAESSPAAGLPVAESSPAAGLPVAESSPAAGLPVAESSSALCTETVDELKRVAAKLKMECERVTASGRKLAAVIQHQLGNGKPDCLVTINVTGMLDPSSLLDQRGRLNSEACSILQPAVTETVGPTSFGMFAFVLTKSGQWILKTTVKRRRGDAVATGGGAVPEPRNDSWMVPPPEEPQSGAAGFDLRTILKDVPGEVRMLPSQGSVQRAVIVQSSAGGGAFARGGSSAGGGASARGDASVGGGASASGGSSAGGGASARGDASVGGGAPARSYVYWMKPPSR